MQAMRTRAGKAYHSPLKELHFKRLIVDEGHGFGTSSRTDAVVVVDFLQLTARWIVSGTPTKGLYGAEISNDVPEDLSGQNSPISTASSVSSIGNPGIFTQQPTRGGGSPNTPNDVIIGSIVDNPLPTPQMSQPTSGEKVCLYSKQERKDLEGLGNIATSYLKVRPWANSPEDQDAASWSQLIMQRRHGRKSRGNFECLRTTLEGMVIRHRPEDVLLEVTLPPLNKRIVVLDGSVQDKLSLNKFSIAIITNAVASERKDADYFFDPRQRKNLQQLVSNLRQASFMWSGFGIADITTTIENAKDFLEEKKVPITPADEALLQEVIQMGETVLANEISQAISIYHEMPMYVQNELPSETRAAWSLDGKAINPTLMGATQVHAAQKFVEDHLWKEDPTEELLDAGKQAMEAAREALMPVSAKSKSLKRKSSIGSEWEGSFAISGGVTGWKGSNPPKRVRSARSLPGKGLKSPSPDHFIDVDAIDDTFLDEADSITNPPPTSLSPTKKKSALKKTHDISGSLDPSSSLAKTSLVSTASAKLSYLLDGISAHHAEDKILIFYEAEQIAWYIAQALEVLDIPHLIYAKTLTAARRAQYVVAFNHSNHFRVLLMDVSQAAFGLDLSSASRVYFVNPPFSPQVEAQAVKRAHRIGQTKPVFVETLVLRGSIEEVIVRRRREMSSEEHHELKSILDDRTVYDWIRDVRIIDVRTEGIEGPEQMAGLARPKLLFGRGSGCENGDPEGYLERKPSTSGVGDQGKGKGEVKMASWDLGLAREERPARKERKPGVSFA